MLAIRTFGGIQLSYNDKLIGKGISRKSQAMLIYLAITERAASREFLGELFWEGLPQSRSLNNLRVSLAQLRKHLPDSLIIERFSVAFNPASESWLDVNDFNQAAADGDTDDALRLYQGDFLEGTHLRGCREFEQWVVTEQEILRQKMITTLQRKVNNCIDSGRYLQGLTYVRRLLDINPLLESAHRQLMRLLAYENQRETALTQYELCREILDDELGVEPSSETRELYQQIQAGGIEAPATPAAPPHNLLPQMTPFFGR
ncbi:MAG: BTAD domain-containing putative transcriptional regulator, partial [Chloroflexota bacterium]